MLIMLGSNGERRLTQLVSNGNAVAGRFGDDRPPVELLGIGKDLGVVAEESVEGAEGSPSSRDYVSRHVRCCRVRAIVPGTEGLSYVSTEAADIRADNGDLVERGELENLGDGQSV